MDRKWIEQYQQKNVLLRFVIWQDKFLQIRWYAIVT